MHQLTTIELLILATGAMLTGLYLLIRGGEWTVDSSVYIARKMGIPAEFIGFTIIAFGTSLPELIVSINANLSGFAGLSIGNVVGSNIANILLIFGVSLLVAPLVFQTKSVRRDLIAMLGATGLLIAANEGGVIERWHGLAMFGLLVSYVIFKFRKNKDDTQKVNQEESVTFSHPAFGWLVLMGGLGAVSLGSEFLVRGAVNIAHVFGMPEAIIGLTIVAFGTSLPELSVAIQSMRQGENDILVGNVVGSNVFNILSILGLTAVTKPLIIDSTIMSTDIWFMATISVILVATAMLFNKLGRLSGVAMLAVYFGYIIFKYVG